MRFGLLKLSLAGAATFCFENMSVFAQTATVLRSSGPAEVLISPNPKPYPDGQQVAYEGQYYRSLKPKIGFRLKDAAILRTGSGGKITIAYQNGDLITVSENSFYKILPVNQTDGKSVTELIQGAVRGHIKKDGPLSGSQVRTKTIVMGIRGTDYYVARPGKTGDTEVVVIRGKVEVTSPSGKTNNVVLNTGQAIATPREMKSVSTPTPFKVVQADKGKLATIQTETMVTPNDAALDRLPPETKAAIRQLERKAAENIMQDIKRETPDVFNAVSTNEKTAIDINAVYAMNTAAVEALYTKAPHPAASADRAAVPEDPKILFARQAPPEAPLAVRPAVDASLAGATLPMQITLSWDRVRGARSYEVQIANNDQFQQIKSSTKLGETEHIVVLTAGTWWWRLRSIDGLNRQGDWGAPRKFAVKLATGPDLAQPTLPALPAQDARIDEKPDWLLVTLGIGGGSYSYKYQKGDYIHERNSSGGGSELTAYALIFRKVFTTVSLSGRSLDDFYNQDEHQDYSVGRLSTAWLYDTTLPFKFTTGLAYASETAPHPIEGTSSADKKNIETLFVDASVMSSDWPKTFFQVLIGYGVVTGSEDLDIRADTTFYGRLRYQRQFFRFPLSLGLGMEYFAQQMHFYTKDNGIKGIYRLKRQPLFFEAGYSF